MILNTPGSGWGRLADYVATEIPVAEIDGVWQFLFVTRDLSTSAPVPVCINLFPSFQYCVLPALLRYFLLSTCIVVLLYYIATPLPLYFIATPHFTRIFWETYLQKNKQKKHQI